MIPTIPPSDRTARWIGVLIAFLAAGSVVLDARAAGDPPGAAPPGAAPPGAAALDAATLTGAQHAAAPAGATLAAQAPAAKTCLSSGDGYLRAHVGGAIEAEIDWPNSGTVCAGEPKIDPAGVRLSFRRVSGAQPNLLFLFGLTGVREGEPLHNAGANLTIIVQGTDRIYGTRGDSRCAVDSLTQRRLGGEHEYRLEARGFCTQPAHAVRGEGVVIVSRFDFAGVVRYEEKSP